MKTALEYFIEQLDCLNIERKKNLIDAETFFKHKKILMQQAKAMEKEQIKNAHIDGGKNQRTAVKYYNETFKKK